MASESVRTFTPDAYKILKAEVQKVVRWGHPREEKADQDLRIQSILQTIGKHFQRMSIRSSRRPTTHFFEFEYPTKVGISRDCCRLEITALGAPPTMRVHKDIRIHLEEPLDVIRALQKEEKQAVDTTSDEDEEIPRQLVVGKIPLRLSREVREGLLGQRAEDHYIWLHEIKQALGYVPADSLTNIKKRKDFYFRYLPKEDRILNVVVERHQKEKIPLMVLTAYIMNRHTSFTKDRVAPTSSDAVYESWYENLEEVGTPP